MSDGPLFPFISAETTSFCPTGCGKTEGLEWITQMKQSLIPQNTKQKMVVAHSMLMLLSFFFLLPTAILSVRFGRQYLRRVCGSFVWSHVNKQQMPKAITDFQMHWLGGLVGFACIFAAFFLVYYQANFRFLHCSSKCSYSVSNLVLHEFM